jgi:hypothetical protein
MRRSHRRCGSDDGTVWEALLDCVRRSDLRQQSSADRRPHHDAAELMLRRHDGLVGAGRLCRDTSPP